MLESFLAFFQSTAFMHLSYGNLIMFAIAGLLIYIAIEKDAEPLLLIPIAFGIILANIPPEITGILNSPTDNSPGGVLWYLQQGLVLGIYPPLIFLGIGALTDFSFMLSYPITIFLGGAAQMGIFITFLLARVFGFTLKQAASIGIIGGADGPTSIFITSKFSPELLSIIAISAYSYIALIPVLQPIVSKLITTKEERKIKMKPPRKVTKAERVLFPIVTTIIVALIVPKALPLVGMLMFGNLLREAGVVKRLVEAASRYILDTVTILLCVSVGSSARADVFLKPQSLLIFGMGAVAFVTSIFSGIMFAKFMNLFLKDKINPLIGGAGVSAVPDSSRVAQRIAQEEDPTNFILMHAMGPNVAGVIGSAVAAGIFLSLIK
ncbi:glutaconyl-CoA decarboxylase subunit beta [Thermosipho melanesiensis]|uniref:Sodium ion-translocating decarboxylase, beta subunit n=2 Tax=Thermosipho melanesiensis TaxID=46541 RepID=A6LP79_THEM4|nr:sodium ion-translocating decarboxylase subunit beta [Thermosipho melanesiensis]ABR31730.1 sodium ion-translocating decarboxylase, beta subunit [Thermosipho melanesiensis BI429]APT74752.1 glutaconyl-CoA decarboxylase subunit beta [Thermosipho melanesiensis]OOC35072.1 glutaconyl-CoA decarboxylase subunit beta [Thermosipho melanesiensis]OOC35108.1 glutaconyl-CoA decarboxylase subunit beta [Thermosipho melanesiensis]OOC36716.1 glutaconyl-CoA decarboxylase subunit beta [Thermosipho melanesiensis